MIEAIMNLAPAFRVHRGAIKLDQIRPNWDKTLDTERLHIGSPNDCVLGQTFGDYEMGLGRLRFTNQEASRYGFNEPHTALASTYARLRNNWLREISKRRQLHAMA